MAIRRGKQVPRYQIFRGAAEVALAAMLALSAALPMPSMAQTSVPASQEEPLSTLALAHQAMQKKQWADLAKMIASASEEDGVLAMYPEYWLLRYQFSVPLLPMPTEAAEAFLKKYPNTYLADRLRGDWILAAAREGDFARVRDLGSVLTGSPQIGCAQLHARHLKGQRATASEALAAFSSGKACWALYKQLTADRVLGWDQLSSQLRDAIDINNTGDARQLAALLFTSAQLKTYDEVMRNPTGWLAKRAHTAPKSRADKLLLAIALVRDARKDRDAADVRYRKTWAALLSKDDRAWVRSQFALIAALNLDEQADKWYREAGLDAYLTEYNHAWRVRSALRQPKIDWTWVRAAIARMPASQQAEPVWVYWNARGLAAVGMKAEAQAQYSRIAGLHHFYGQLAAEELGQAITVPPNPAPVTPQEVAQVSTNPGLQRALLLFREGLRREAVPEWNFALRGMSDRQLRAAAELARQEQIYDRVVNTSEQADGEVDFSQRFIAPFEGRVTAQAKEISLDPAWVYGLIRQESRFVTEARSHVGASGLMQLMPATAKWTAKKIGMTDFHPSKVNEFETNTTLGTNYLNIVLQGLDGSQVLASAGYNAGPGRPKLWRSRLSHSVEGAIFAETIPFTETRIYVKNVLSNATYYAAIFSGKPQSLKARLGHIAPEPVQVSQNP